MAEDKFRVRKMVSEEKHKGQEKMKMREWTAKLPTEKAQTSRAQCGKQMLREQFEMERANAIPDLSLRIRPYMASVAGEATVASMNPMKFLQV